MSKITPTPIRDYWHIHRTNKLYAVAAGLALWTLLTTLLTFAAINSKYFHNTYQCEATTVQPTKTLATPKDQKQSKLISRISTLYKVPKQEVYHLLGVIRAYTEHHKFPTTEMVLAVIAVESRFQQHATSSVGAKGLMQITKESGKDSTYEIWSNLKGGIELLREYRTALGSDSAAVTAFNIGIGAYKRGLRSPDYLAKIYLNKGIIEGS